MRNARRRPRVPSTRPGHAHPARNIPGQQSIAGYAYELIHEGSRKPRTTSWAPEEGGVVKQVLARHWTSLAAAKDKITGKKGE